MPDAEAGRIQADVGQRPVGAAVDAFLSGLVVEIAAEKGQRRSLAEPCGQRRRDELPVVGLGQAEVVVDRGIRVAQEPGQPVEEASLRVDRAADVDGALPAGEAARLELDLAQRVGRRQLAAAIDEPAGVGLPEERRGRSAQHLVAVDAIGLVAVVDRAHQAVDEAAAERRGEAANGEERVLLVFRPAERLREDAGRIGQRLAVGLHVANREFMAGDDGNGLGRREERRRAFQRRRRSGVEETSRGGAPQPKSYREGARPELAPVPPSPA